MKKAVSLLFAGMVAVVAATGAFSNESPETENPCRFVCVPNCAECDEHLAPAGE